MIGQSGFDRHAVGDGLGGRRRLHDRSLGEIRWLARRGASGGVVVQLTMSLFVVVGERWMDGEMLAT